MSSGAAISSVIKNKSTERNREFWYHVETVAAQARDRREIAVGQISSQNEVCLIRERVAVPDPFGCLDRSEGN